MADELARAKKKYIAFKRAERRLETRLADIDWEYDVLLPEIAQLELAAATSLELPDFTIVEDDN
jgi:hypothetical protein